MLFYNNLNSFSKDQIGLVAIDEFLLFVEKILGVSGLGFDGPILFNFEKIGFCSICRKRYGVTEVLD